MQFEKGTKGLYHYFRELYPAPIKLSDTLPALLEKKYLKTIYCCHECQGTLDRTGNGKELSVLYLDLQDVYFYPGCCRPALDTKTFAGITCCIIDILYPFVPWNGLYIFCNSFPPLPDFFHSFSIVHIFTPVHQTE
jgi:hypothetical protein